MPEEVAATQPGAGLHPIRTERANPIRTECSEGISGSSQSPCWVRAMTDTGSAIADLQSHWHALCDLDRARAVQSIHQDGMSLRALAPQLNCSPSLLSHLLRAAQAPAEDRELARCGEMSTRELARRAGTSRTRSTSTPREAIAFDRERAAAQASQAITRWLDEVKVANADRDRVIEQACLLHVKADRSAARSLEDYLPDIPLVEVIRLFRPAPSESDGDRPVAWFAKWLALWTLHGILDDRVRFRALELARSEMPT